MATTDICLPVFIEKESNTWNTDKLSIGIGFLVGLIVGGLIAFGCSKLCMKDIAKKKVSIYEDT